MSSTKFSILPSSYGSPADILKTYRGANQIPLVEGVGVGGVFDLAAQDPEELYRQPEVFITLPAKTPLLQISSLDRGAEPAPLTRASQGYSSFDRGAQQKSAVLLLDGPPTPAFA